MLQLTELQKCNLKKHKNIRTLCRQFRPGKPNNIPLQLDYLQGRVDFAHKGAGKLSGYS